jgi:hypothetical protein
MRIVRQILTPAVFLLAMAAGVRLYMAADFHHAHDFRYGVNQVADRGIHALMAKHMAEGVDYPVLFYGQSYMGSLEPAISAVFYKLFGSSLFVICLGTIALGLAALVVLYALGKRMGGRTAGLTVLSLLSAGPPLLLWFSVSPRGGYMATFLLAWLAIWLALRTTTLERPNSFPPYAALGLVAGLAWWTNQLTLSALITAGLIVWAGWRGRIHIRPVFVALVCFLIGSAPWWLWNATHGWRTFAFGSAIGWGHAATGFRFFMTYLDGFINDTSTHHMACWIRRLAWGGLAACSLIEGWRARRQPRGMAILAAWLMVLLPMVLFVFSRTAQGWAGARFLILMLPAMALIAAAGVAAAARRAGTWVFPTTVLLLASGQLNGVRDMITRRGTDQVGWDTAQPFMRFCRDAGVKVVYGDYTFHWANFATDEQICLTSGDDDRYVPYAQKAELARDCGFLAGYGGLEGFLQTTSASWSQTNLALSSLIYNLRHAPWTPTATAAAGVAVGDDHGMGAEPALTDGDLDTHWRFELKPGDRRLLRMDFVQPQPVCGIRLLSVNDTYPPIESIRVISTNGEQVVVKDFSYTGFFWSGPRVYRADAQYVPELLFAPREAQAVEVLFASPDTNTTRNGLLSEVELLMPSSSTWPTNWFEAEAGTLMAKHGIKRLYAPRWLSVQCYEQSGRRLEIPRPAALRRESIYKYGYDPLCGVIPLELTRETMLILMRENLSRSIDALQRHGIVPHVELLGPYAALRFDHGYSPEELALCKNLYWAESGVYGGTGHRKAKELARLLFDQAARQPQHAVELLSRCVAVYSDYQPAWLALEVLYQRTGDEVSWRRVQEENRLRTEPTTACVARFSNGAEFLGLRTSTNRLTTGQQGEVIFYWRVPPGFVPQQWAAFLHFRRGKAQFEGDAVLLANYPDERVAYQPFRETFRQTMRFQVPANMTTGDYEVYMGLYDRLSGKRLRVSSPCKAPQRCLKPGNVLTVVRDTP